jgi:hypothetical protein
MTHIYEAEDNQPKRPRTRMVGQEKTILLRWTAREDGLMQPGESEISKDSLQDAVLKLYREGVNPEDIYYWETKHTVTLSVATTAPPPAARG